MISYRVNNVENGFHVMITREDVRGNYTEEEFVFTKLPQVIKFMKATYNTQPPAVEDPPF